MLQKTARNVLMGPLWLLIKLPEHKVRIASHALKVRYSNYDNPNKESIHQKRVYSFPRKTCYYSFLILPRF